jgi:phage gpG-like protein
VQVNFEPLGDPEAVAGCLGELRDRAADLWSAFPVFADAVREIERGRFATGGYGQWQPLAAATIASKAAAGYDTNRILYATGRLEESVVGFTGDSVIHVGPDEVFVGTSTPYAHWHQTGGFRLHASGAGWPPKRTIYEFSDAERLALLDVIAGFLFEGEAGAAAGLGAVGDAALGAA